MRHTASSPPAWRAILRWPAFLAANLAILLLVGISTVRETYRGWTVEREIHALDAQAQTLEDRKLKLVELTNSLSDPQHVELDARSRLGLKKDGERVVVLTGWQASTTAGANGVTFTDEPVEPPPASNPVQWFHYFFTPHT